MHQVGPLVTRHCCSLPTPAITTDVVGTAATAGGSANGDDATATRSAL
jgi:hypothetical protein